MYLRTKEFLLQTRPLALLQVAAVEQAREERGNSSVRGLAYILKNEFEGCTEPIFNAKSSAQATDSLFCMATANMNRQPNARPVFA
jgi:hypothetical protein